MAAPGFRLEVHEALTSTSDLVAERAAAGEAAGLAVLAHRQTAGRGTQGRAWQSPTGNLYMTVLLRPGGPLRDAPQWALLAGVAVAEAIAPWLPDPAALTLKWPNDALLHGRKIAGILSEAASDADGAVAWISLGIGVNLAMSPEVPGRATASLAGEGIVPPAPTEFAPRLLDRIGHWYDQRQSHGFAAIRSAWLAHGPRPDTTIRVAAPGGAMLDGRFAGLAEDGSLLLAAGDAVRRLTAGEVTI